MSLGLGFCLSCESHLQANVSQLRIRRKVRNELVAVRWWYIASFIFWPVMSPVQKVFLSSLLFLPGFSVTKTPNSFKMFDTGNYCANDRVEVLTGVIIVNRSGVPFLSSPTQKWVVNTK